MIKKFQTIIFVVIIIFFIIKYLLNNQSKAEKIIEQLNRNLIETSKKLHKTLQIKGQLECEKSLNDVSNSGGWCSKIRKYSNRMVSTKRATFH